MPQQSKNGQVIDFSGYRLPPVHETVTCELPEINEGLTRPLEITVLVNPTRGEIVTMANEIQASLDRHQLYFERRVEARKKAKEAGETPPPMFDADADRAMDMEVGAIIAPRIVGWNVQALNRNGEMVDVPAPGQRGGNEHFSIAPDAIPGPGVMDLLNMRQRQWILRIVRSAHLGGETRSKLSTRPAATDDTEGEKTPSGPRVVSTQTGESRQSRRKSS